MADEQQEEQQQVTRKRGDRWFLFLMIGLFVFGLGARGYSYVTRPTGQPRVLRQQRASNYTQKAFPGSSEGMGIPQTSLEENGLMFNLASYLTEGGLSFFIGFCIGYVLRLVAKTAMLLIGALYLCLILLSHYGMVTVDWGSFQEVVQHLLLNAQTQVEGVRGMLVVSLPSAVMGGIGMWRGLKKS